MTLDDLDFFFGNFVLSQQSKNTNWKQCENI